MAFEVALPNFSKGEIAPSLYGRIDTSQYSAGLRQCKNFIVQKYGGVTFRPGTRIVGKVDDPTLPVRLAPFQFSIDQAYALLLQQGSMRPMALGGFVLEQNTKITGATKAAACVLAVTLHGYSVGDRIYLSGIVGMTELNGRFATVTAVPDTDHIAIDVDSTAFGTFVSSDGVTNSAPPPPPPAPPVVPPVVEPPAPPVVGGGGGGGERCVSADTTMIRMANDVRDGPGVEKLARYVRIGEAVWTQHEHTLAWGAHEVVAIELAEEDIMAAPGYPDATPRHRFLLDGVWVQMDAIGVPAGRSVVWKATVKDAHTYLSRNIDRRRWVLSHNIKQQISVEN